MQCKLHQRRGDLRNCGRSQESKGVWSEAQLDERGSFYDLFRSPLLPFVAWTVRPQVGLPRRGYVAERTSWSPPAPRRGSRYLFDVDDVITGFPFPILYGPGVQNKESANNRTSLKTYVGQQCQTRLSKPAYTDVQDLSHTEVWCSYLQATLETEW